LGKVLKVFKNTSVSHADSARLQHIKNTSRARFF
jgi:hypothetical protein